MVLLNTVHCELHCAAAIKGWVISRTVKANHSSVCACVCVCVCVCLCVCTSVQGITVQWLCPSYACVHVYRLEHSEAALCKHSLHMKLYSMQPTLCFTETI